MPQITGRGLSKPEPVGEIRLQRTEDVEGRTQRRHAGFETERLDERGVVPGARCPKIGMGAERRRLVHRDPGQPPRPVLRIGDDVLDPRKGLREAAGLPEELRADVQSARQMGRKALRERRSQGVVVPPEPVGTVMLVVEHRKHQAVAIEQRRRSPMRGHHQGIGSGVGVPRQFGQSVEQQGRDGVRVVVRVEAVPQHPIGGGPHNALAARLGIVQQQFDVGLADVEDGDGLDGGAHARWKIGTSGRTTGARDASTSMRSAIWSHQRRMTG